MHGCGKFDFSTGQGGDLPALSSSHLHFSRLVGQTNLPINFNSRLIIIAAFCTSCGANCGATKWTFVIGLHFPRRPRLYFTVRPSEHKAQLKCQLGNLLVLACVYSVLYAIWQQFSFSLALIFHDFTALFRRKARGEMKINFLSAFVQQNLLSCALAQLSYEILCVQNAD